VAHIIVLIDHSDILNSVQMVFVTTKLRLAAYSGSTT